LHAFILCSNYTDVHPADASDADVPTFSTSAIETPASTTDRRNAREKRKRNTPTLDAEMIFGAVMLKCRNGCKVFVQKKNKEKCDWSLQTARSQSYGRNAGETGLEMSLGVGNAELCNSR
jgi:hypothetical protein